MYHKKKRYTSDLTDEAWKIVKPLFAPERKGRGRPIELDMREVLNAILYVVRTGCQWENLPKDFPNHNSVYYHFRKRCLDGTWRQINTILRKLDRRKRGRTEDPTAGVIDTQSVKTTEAGGERGFDAFKRINGRKRHIVVDTIGNLLEVVVHAAGIQDYHGAKLMLIKLTETVSSLQKIWADGIYKNGGLVDWVRETLDIALAVVERPPSQDAVSQLWNHVTGQFRAWERAPQPPRHFQGMLPAEFTPEQFKKARDRVRAYNRTIARAMQADDEKALVSAIQELESWSEGISENRRTWAQAGWHAAHETERPGATASAAFHAFRPEMLAPLAAPQPRPMTEIVILGAQHADNLGERVVEYDQPQTVRLRVLLEDYTDTYGRIERRLAAYELGDEDQPGQRIDYLPKDSPRQTGHYLATLQRPAGKKWIEGRIVPLQGSAAT